MSRLARAREQLRIHLSDASLSTPAASATAPHLTRIK
jgi:hypothetical protein